MSLQYAKNMLGKEAFESLPRFGDCVYLRPLTGGEYRDITNEDMTYSVMLFDMEEAPYAFLAIKVGAKESHWFDYGGIEQRADLFPDACNNKPTDHILVYTFIEDYVGMCRHGRPLYDGPFTLELDLLPLRRDCSPLMLPLHNFLCGRLEPTLIK